MKRKAWRKYVQQVLKDRPGHQWSCKKVAKHAVKAARLAGEDADEQGFQEFERRARATDDGKLCFSGKHVYLPKPGLGASKAEATSTPGITQQPPQVPPPTPTPMPNTAASEVSGRGTKRQRAQLQLDSLQTQPHPRKQASQQSGPAEQTSPLSSGPGSSAKRLEPSGAVTASGQHQQAVPGSRAPADPHRSKRGKSKARQEAAPAKAQQAETPPRPAQTASPVSAVPDSPVQARKRRKQGPPDAGPARQQKQKRRRTSQPSEAAATSQEAGQGPAAVAEQSLEQPVASKPKPRRRKAGAGSTPDPSPTTAAGARGDGRNQKAGGTSKMPELPAGMTWEDSGKRTDVKKGRFSAQEKEGIERAVKQHAAACDLPTDDLSWVIGVRKGEDLSEEQRATAKGVFQALGDAMPHRTIRSTYMCLQRMCHQGNYLGRWSAAEDAQLRQAVITEGRKWRRIGDQLGRLPETCRDRWRKLELGDRRVTGAWSPEEVQALREAVAEHQTDREEAGDQIDIHNQAANGQRGHINFDVVARKMGTRSRDQCLDKWYRQLAPSMLEQGLWHSGDDRRLLRALLRLGPPEHEFMVDWSHLEGLSCLPGQAERRWQLIVKLVPGYWNLTFPQQVRTMVELHAPKLLSLPTYLGPQSPSAGCRPPAAGPLTGI